jgi:hypothetical protein
MITRRQALGLIPLFLLNAAARRTTVHPTPRRGITAARVLKDADLHGVDPEVIQVFDMIREIPQVVDGIFCHCGCHDMPDHYSLLSCYEGDGMAQSCRICQGEGRLAARLHQQGHGLDEIRAAIDKNFG